MPLKTSFGLLFTKILDRTGIGYAIARSVKPLLYSMVHVHGPKERLSIGSRSDVANAYFNTRSGNIKIGDECMVAHNVMLLTGFHDYQKKGRERDVPNDGRDITIGNGVWVASGATIIGPSRIGDNSVIAAGSVVVKADIPANVLAAGNPAKVVKKIDFNRDV